MECGQYGWINYLISFGTFLKVDIWFSISVENVYEELRLQGLFLPLRWSYHLSAGGSWSTPPVSEWWGRPLSAVSWSGRSSRTTEWSLWRGTLPWTVNTGRSWRSAASVWESLLPYQRCSSMDTTSGSACPFHLIQWELHGQQRSKPELWDLFHRVLRKYWAWTSPESFKTFWQKLRYFFLNLFYWEVQWNSSK